MATFQVLSGKALAAAIKGRGKQVQTFTAREHQLAYSALNHVEEHHCVSHLNNLLAVTPTNYRKGLIDWAKEFGKVAFDSEAKAFTYAKSKASDLPAAMATAPADFQRTANKTASSKALVERVESMASKAIESTETNAEDRAFARALANFVKSYKGSMGDNVVKMDQAA